MVKYFKVMTFFPKFILATWATPRLHTCMNLGRKNIYQHLQDHSQKILLVWNYPKCCSRTLTFVRTAAWGENNSGVMRPWTVILNRKVRRIMFAPGIIIHEKWVIGKSLLSPGTSSGALGGTAPSQSLLAPKCIWLSCWGQGRKKLSPKACCQRAWSTNTQHSWVTDFFTWKSKIKDWRQHF